MPPHPAVPDERATHGLEGPAPIRAQRGAPSEPEVSQTGGQRGSYGEIIAAQRQGAGVSRAELGARIGVPTHTIALWEDPSYEGVDLSILQRVARATGSALEIRFRAPVRSAPAPTTLLEPNQP